MKNFVHFLRLKPENLKWLFLKGEIFNSLQLRLLLVFLNNTQRYVIYLLIYTGKLSSGHGSLDIPFFLATGISFFGATIATLLKIFELPRDLDMRAQQKGNVYMTAVPTPRLLLGRP